jgi:hypothetical protein
LYKGKRLSPEILSKERRLLLIERSPSIASIVIFANLVLHTLGYAASDSVRLQERQCVPVDSVQRAQLPQSFTKYVSFVKSCPVGIFGAKPALFIVAVWVDDYYTSQPGTPYSEDIPKPVIVATDGRLLGALPEAYPGALPLATKLVFRNWRRSWPNRIEIIASTAALGSPPRYKPLIWDDAKSLFISSGD